MELSWNKKVILTGHPKKTQIEILQKSCKIDDIKDLSLEEENMIFEYDKMEWKSIANFNGGEKCADMKSFLDENNRILMGKLEPGASIGIHTHEGNSEIVFAVSGEAVVTMDGKKEILKAGTAHYCPTGHTHGMKNESDQPFVMFAVVPFHHVEK